MQREAKTGTAAIVAIVLAIGSFVLTFMGHPIWALLAALFAIAAGAVGLAMSISPKVGGGLMSVVAIILGVFGLGVAVLGLIGVILF